MRVDDILFRGKRVDNGEWVYGYLFKGVDYLDRHHIVAIIEENTDIYPRSEVAYEEVDPETVGQYVGKFVTTGVNVTQWAKIFEGDILQCLVPEWPEDSVPYRCPIEYSVRKGVVSYEKDLGEYRLRLYKNGEYWKRINLWEYGIKRLNVIGNIHDNPDLLTNNTFITE